MSLIWTFPSKDIESVVSLHAISTVKSYYRRGGGRRWEKVGEGAMEIE
jgi:hypothetical protein